MAPFQIPGAMKVLIFMQTDVEQQQKNVLYSQEEYGSWVSDTSLLCHLALLHHCIYFYYLMPYHYSHRITQVGRHFPRSLLQAPACSRTTQSRLVKAMTSQGLSICKDGGSTASVSSFQFCFLKYMHKWGGFFQYPTGKSFCAQMKRQNI